MADLSERDHRAITELKARYLRALDTKDWALLESTLTPDVSASYAGGAQAAEGRDELVALLSTSLAPDTLHTSHRCSQPELAADGADRATGRWALTDVVLESEHRFWLTGAGFYEDVYRRGEDGWRIAVTRYDRTYELSQPWPAEASLTGSAWLTGGRSTLGG